MSGSSEADMLISQCLKKLEKFTPKMTGQNGQSASRTNQRNLSFCFAEEVLHERWGIGPLGADLQEEASNRLKLH